jgi:hypothetical protein
MSRHYMSWGPGDKCERKFCAHWSSLCRRLVGVSKPSSRKIRGMLLTLTYTGCSVSWILHLHCSHAMQMAIVGGDLPLNPTCLQDVLSHGKISLDCFILFCFSINSIFLGWGGGDFPVWATYCLLPLEYRDYGFESHSRHGCMSAYFSVCAVLCRYGPCNVPIPRPRSPTNCMIHIVRG